MAATTYRFTKRVNVDVEGFGRDFMALCAHLAAFGVTISSISMIGNEGRITLSDAIPDRQLAHLGLSL